MYLLLLVIHCCQALARHAKRFVGIFKLALLCKQDFKSKLFAFSYCTYCIYGILYIYTVQDSEPDH